MKCTKCGNEIKENEKCPYCEKNKMTWIVGIVMLMLVLLAFIPGILNDKKEADELDHEKQLIEEGKVVTDTEVIEQIIKILKDRNEKSLSQYATTDSEYWRNGEKESMRSFWDDLKYLVENNYTLEARENSIEGQKTYIIYWNTNNVITDKTNSLYCLQKITIILKRVVKEDIITYNIKKIILTDN